MTSRSRKCHVCSVLVVRMGACGARIGRAAVRQADGHGPPATTEHTDDAHPWRRRPGAGGFGAGRGL